MTDPNIPKPCICVTTPCFPQAAPEEAPQQDAQTSCSCSDETSTDGSLLTPQCDCPRDDYNIPLHIETCIMYKNETIIYPHVAESCECVSPRFEGGVCKCCRCPPQLCRCKKAGRKVFDEWRSKRDVGAMPAVLETTHPLMQRFQETLRGFLLKENALAEEEIKNLRDELKQSKQEYDKGLESIYRHDHDTNAQRVLIQEYETNLAKLTADRAAADQRVKNSNEKYKAIKEKMEKDNNTEREATEELNALTNLCRQLEQWREETQSDLTVSHTMADRMKNEKLTLAQEKRELDIIIFSLGNEVWKLESKLEMLKKQIEIKNNEMAEVNDRVTAYAAELEDLDLDKRRLVSLWNSVLVNISQRDKVYDSVRDDYKNLQENYRTLMSNLEITKKMLMDEMNKGKEIEMNKDKLKYDTEAVNKILETEENKRIMLENQIQELTESIEMTDRDEQLVRAENQTMRNILKSTTSNLERKTEQKLKLENEILSNIKDILLNDKAIQSMANGITKMRAMTRTLEISLMAMENQHAKVMLDIEVHRNNQARTKIIVDKMSEKVREKEKELDQLQENFDQGVLMTMRKQRELDIVTKKYMLLKEIFDSKSPQERRIEELESKIKAFRERTELVQQEWLRLQGHVVKLTEQHQKTIADNYLVHKQIQICDQKTMRIQADAENVMAERGKVERTLRELRGKLEVLERTRKDSIERNQSYQRANVAITHEYTANLKDAEFEIIQLEEELETLEKDKINMTQELDRVQREALIWQRKGILAVELKRNIKEAKSTAGEIGQMKNEIHRMEMRREQLRRTGEKLAEDLAQYVNRRETALDKCRATAAVEKAHGTSHTTSQSTFEYKLKMAKSDVTRVTKDISEAKAQLKQLKQEQERLDRELAETTTSNANLEEHVANLMKECRESDRQKQWLLERVVRSQRLGSELATAIKRQSVRVKRAKPQVLKEYEQAVDLNTKLYEIVNILKDEYPHLSERFDIVANTLNIHSPSGTPRMIK